MTIEVKQYEHDGRCFQPPMDVVLDGQGKCKGVKVRCLSGAGHDADGCYDWVREFWESGVISQFGGVARKGRHSESIDDD